MSLLGEGAGWTAAGQRPQLRGTLIDGRAVATLTATDLGTVTYMVDPGLLNLAAGRHVVQLNSVLVTMTSAFSSH
jgi:hypothetical protein